MLYTLNFQKILQYFFPRECIICNIENKYLCNNCEKNIYPSKKDLPDWIYSKYNYKDKYIKKLLFKLKYSHTRDIGIELGEYIAKSIRENIIKENQNYILIPIPITKERFRDRGYNQAEIIALGIKNKIENIEIYNILIRVKETSKLNKIKTRLEREYELENAFNINEIEIGKLSNIKDINIIIIDDITTSGASLYSARKTLIEYGFSKENISGFTVAH